MKDRNCIMVRDKDLELSSNIAYGFLGQWFDHLESVNFTDTEGNGDFI